MPNRITSVDFAEHESPHSRIDGLSAISSEVGSNKQISASRHVGTVNGYMEFNTSDGLIRGPVSNINDGRAVVKTAEQSYIISPPHNDAPRGTLQPISRDGSEQPALQIKSSRPYDVFAAEPKVSVPNVEGGRPAQEQAKSPCAVSDSKVVATADSSEREQRVSAAAATDKGQTRGDSDSRIQIASASDDSRSGWRSTAIAEPKEQVPSSDVRKAEKSQDSPARGEQMEKIERLQQEQSERGQLGERNMTIAQSSAASRSDLAERTKSIETSRSDLAEHPRSIETSRSDLAEHTKSIETSRPAERASENTGRTRTDDREVAKAVDDSKTGWANHVRESSNSARTEQVNGGRNETATRGARVQQTNGDGRTEDNGGSQMTRTTRIWTRPEDRIEVAGEHGGAKTVHTHAGDRIRSGEDGEKDTKIVHLHSDDSDPAVHAEKDAKIIHLHNDDSDPAVRTEKDSKIVHLHSDDSDHTSRAEKDAKIVHLHNDDLDQPNMFVLDRTRSVSALADRLVDNLIKRMQAPQVQDIVAKQPHTVFDNLKCREIKECVVQFLGLVERKTLTPNMTPQAQKIIRIADDLGNDKLRAFTMRIRQTPDGQAPKFNDVASSDKFKFATLVRLVMKDLTARQGKTETARTALQEFATKVRTVLTGLGQASKSGKGNETVCEARGGKTRTVMSPETVLSPIRGLSPAATGRRVPAATERREPAATERGDEGQLVKVVEPRISNLCGHCGGVNLNGATKCVLCKKELKSRPDSGVRVLPPKRFWDQASRAGKSKSVPADLVPQRCVGLSE